MTSTSEEAAVTMRQAMEKMGHDTPAMQQLIGKAYKMDPNMIVANVFMAMGAEPAKTKPFQEAVAAHKGEMNEGEKLFAEAMKHADDTSYAYSALMAPITNIYPKDAALHMLLGYIYMQEEKAEEAIAHFQKAIELKDLKGAYNMLGYIYMEAGEMDKAGQAFESYMSVAEDHPNPYDSMGDYYMAAKDYKAAAESYEKAAAMDEAYAYSKEKAAKAREMMNE